MDNEFVSDMSEEEEQHDGDVNDSNEKSEPCSNIPFCIGEQHCKEITYSIWWAVTRWLLSVILRTSCSGFRRL
jgi:hypothetical protein